MERREAPIGILQGIRIIDSGIWIAGTGAGALLGDLGAEVIKIEDPVHGDSYRGMTTQYGDTMSVKGRHVGFETANMNKKSLTLNLKSERGREILYQLLAKSDIFHTNYPLGTVEKLGIGYETLKAYNPKLIYGGTTTYGSRGPLRDRRGYDTLAQARSGVMWEMGDKDFDEPVGMVGAVFDQLAATLMAFGMVCALVARERYGIGQEVRTSLLGGAHHLQRHNLNMALWRGRPLSRFARRKSANPMSNNYRCADGKWIMLAEPMSDRFWAEFCEAVGIMHLKDEPKFAVHFGGRSKHNVELIKILDQVFASKPRDEWIRIFEGKNVGFGYSPIYDVSEAVRDPQAIENEYIVDFNHPVLGEIKMAGFPIWFKETPARTAMAAPEHGQHTEEVLIDILDYDWEEITRLRSDGII
jgi:crotonobetainyl-CoA:carnitine CoA-transferase CaiB-like acyl-CoA transferase